MHSGIIPMHGGAEHPLDKYSQGEVAGIIIGIICLGTCILTTCGILLMFLFDRLFKKN